MAELGDWWEGCSDNLESTYARRAGRLIALASQESPWTDMEAWSRYWRCPFNAETIASEIDMEEILWLLTGEY